MSNKTSFVNRFMNFPGKSRAVLGPADSSSINPRMTAEKAAELEAHQLQAASEWRTIERADGSFYLLPTDK